MDTPSRPRSPWLVWLALLAFTADVLIYYFTITPLRQWGDLTFDAEWVGTLAHYGLRAVSALLFGFAMVHWKAVETRELGLSFHPFNEDRSEEHTSELQSQSNLVCRLLLEKKKKKKKKKF